MDFGLRSDLCPTYPTCPISTSTSTYLPTYLPTYARVSRAYS